LPDLFSTQNKVAMIYTDSFLVTFKIDFELITLSGFVVEQFWVADFSRSDDFPLPLHSVFRSDHMPCSPCHR